jgi:hypothetical protein
MRKMKDEPGGSETRLSEEIDPGGPVAALAQFENDTSRDLIVRTRRTIHRRATAAHLTSFAATMPLVVLREFWLVLIHRSAQ